VCKFNLLPTNVSDVRLPPILHLSKWNENFDDGFPAINNIPYFSLKVNIFLEQNKIERGFEV